jgi:hypothetical protein
VDADEHVGFAGDVAVDERNVLFLVRLTGDGARVTVVNRPCRVGSGAVATWLERVEVDGEGV